MSRAKATSQSAARMKPPGGMRLGPRGFAPGGSIPVDCVVVVTVTVDLAAVVPSIVSPGGVHVQFVACGRPLHDNKTTWLNPLIGVTVRV